MGDQLTTSAAALRMFFTDDIYLVSGDEQVTVTSLAEQDTAAAVEAIATAVLPATPLAPAADYKYLGKNQKNVLILVKDGQHDVSTERGRELLRNIVKALQLTANDFALLNYHHYDNQQLAALTGFFSSKLVMAFGVGPQQLGLSAHPDNTLVMDGKIQLVFSKNLDMLADNQAEKKVLWGSLKKIQL